MNMTILLLRLKNDGAIGKVSRDLDFASVLQPAFCLSRQIRAQGDIRLHREYNLVMKNKRLRRLQKYGVKGTYALHMSRQEHRGIFELKINQKPGHLLLRTLAIICQRLLIFISKIN